MQPEPQAQPSDMMADTTLDSDPRVLEDGEVIHPAMLVPQMEDDKAPNHMSSSVVKDERSLDYPLPIDKGKG